MHIETPVLERCEILLAKAGGDTEKQIYKVFKLAGIERLARLEDTIHYKGR